MVVSRLPQGEKHGAIISVTTGDEFVGLDVELLLGDKVLSQKSVPQSKALSFTNLIVEGNYIVKGLVNGIYYSDTVTLTAENILNRESVNAIIEVPKANILVATDDEDLVGEQMDLYLGETLVKSGIITSELNCLFEGIVNAGTYIAKVGDLDSEDITVTQDNIDNKETVEGEILSKLKLTVGSIYSFGGYNWMCTEDVGTHYRLHNTSKITLSNWPAWNFGVSNIDGLNLVSNSYSFSGKSAITTVYNAIKKAEYLGSDRYSSGLYIIPASWAFSSTDYSYTKINGNSIYSLALGYLAMASPSWYTVMMSRRVYNSDTAYILCVQRSSSKYREMGFYAPCDEDQSTFSAGLGVCFNLDKTKAILDGSRIYAK